MLTGQILYPPPFRTEGTLRTTTIAFVPTIPFHTRALRGNFILGSTLCHIMSHPDLNWNNNTFGQSFLVTTWFSLPNNHYPFV